jgi:GNAT superfamily N-acetyltransferase
MAACVAVMRQVHEVSGYPAFWPEDPAGWLDPPGTVDAWLAERAGLIAGHIMLVQGAAAHCLLRATGRAPDELGRIARLFAAPAAWRVGLAAALLATATAGARAHGLQPVLDVVDDGYAAIALYERSGWKLVGSETANWTTPAGVSPTLRYYVTLLRTSLRSVLASAGRRRLIWPSPVPAPGAGGWIP